MKKLLSKQWWEAAGTRAIKTFAQTFVGSVTVGMAVQDINWVTLCSVSAVAALLSLCTSIAGLPGVDDKLTKGE